MNINKIVIIMWNDLLVYPPMQTIIKLLVKNNIKVTYIGKCTSDIMLTDFEKMGVEFVDPKLSCGSNSFSLAFCLHKYSVFIKQKLPELIHSENDLVWYVYSPFTFIGIQTILERYKYILHYFELEPVLNSVKYKLFNHSYNQATFAKGAICVIHCEYNRAQICKGLLGLDTVPMVLHNKPLVDDDELSSPSGEVVNQINNLIEVLNNKKVILYQGIFLANERRLEEFCQAIEKLPEEFVLLAMGRGNDYYENLKKQYSSDRIIFAPFIRPPYHLLITHKAHIGVMTYFPMQRQFADVLNSFYCAPNKIFEYSRFGVPMVSNDVPALRQIFKDYNCGEIVEDPITATNVASSILKIDEKYNELSINSKKYYNSIDIDIEFSSILKFISDKL